MKDIVVKDNALVPTSKPLRTLFERTSGGMDRVAGDFDGYVLCGMGTTLGSVMPIMKNYTCESHLPSGIPLSDTCYRACFLGCSRGTMMAEILTKFRHGGKTKQAEERVIAFFANSPAHRRFS
jgi:hypothetical protein